MGKGERGGGLGGMVSPAINKAAIAPGMGAPSVQPGITGGVETVPMSPTARKTPQVGRVGPPQPQRFALGGMGGSGIGGPSPDRYGNHIGGMLGMGGPSPDFWQQIMQMMGQKRIGGF